MKYFIIIFLIFSVSFTGCKPKLHILPNDEIYSCPNDLHVLSDKPGKCPNDNKDLVKKHITEEQRQMIINGSYTKAKN